MFSGASSSGVRVARRAGDRRHGGMVVAWIAIVPPSATVPIPNGDLLVVDREYRCNIPEQGP